MADEIGALACTASVILNISPVRDVFAINKTGSVTERSILPYCMMMVDGANWVVFAWLVDDVFPIGVTNGFGCLAGIAYSAVYLRHCRDDKREGVRRRAWIIFFTALAIVGLMTTTGLTIALVWSKDTAEDSVGYFVDFFNVGLYASPLSLAWQVLRTGSTSGMYLPLSITITAAAALWATYGFLVSDWFVAAPQSAGLLAGLAQLSLFARYGVADNNQSPQVRGAGDVGRRSGNGYPSPPDEGAGAPAAGAADPAAAAARGATATATARGGGDSGSDSDNTGGGGGGGSDDGRGGGGGRLRLSDGSDVNRAPPRGGGGGGLEEPLIPGN